MVRERPAARSSSVQACRSIDFSEAQGRPAIIVGYPGFSCGKDPTEVCDVVKTWNGSAFAGMPVPATTRTAGIKNAKSLGPIRKVLAEVIAMYGEGQTPPFASDAAVMRKHVTAQFTSLWGRAMAQNDGTLDGDPFAGDGVSSINLQGLDIIAETPDSATVETHLAGTFSDNTGYTGNIKVWMRREGSSWKIDDIASDSENGAWKGYIEKALAK